VVKAYKAAIQQTLDILFLRGGTDFITSSDCVSRDSADRTLIAWDYQSTAKVSNQIYHCDFSLDGAILASGSSTGSAHFYDYQSTRVLHAIRAHSQPCLCVSQHPVLPATAATCDWAGEIKIWH
ncbi:hypothetical protein XENOCAPTIV_008450, partial [Xenoophorus captivus]